MVFLRSAVIDMETQMMSICFDVSAGMMPSQATSTSSHFSLICCTDGIHQVDFPADPFAGSILRGERRVGLGGHAELQVGLGLRRQPMSHGIAERPPIERR